MNPKQGVKNSTKNLAGYQRIWLVGASSGIGEALVKALDEPGRTLFVSARSAPALQALADQAVGEIVAVPMDMTQSDQVEAAVEQIAQTGGLDMVVFNAGTCEYMDSTNLDMALLRRVMETNLFSVADLMGRALPLLRMQLEEEGGRQEEHPAPKLVVMSSSVSYQALPRAHAYGASKAALRYYTECLKADVQKEGIDVRVVSPGFVKTPLTDKNDFAMPGRISAEEAAQRIISGLEGKRFDISFPKRFVWGLKTFASLPDVFKFKLLARLSRHPEKMSEQTHRSLEATQPTNQH